MNDTAHPSSSSAHHSAIGVKTYLIVFAALMILLFATVAAAFLPHVWGGWPNVAIALTIACIKTALVVVFFMHVKEASKLTKTIILVSCFWLGLLFMFLASDYLTRDQNGLSNGWNTQVNSIESGEGRDLRRLP